MLQNQVIDLSGIWLSLHRVPEESKGFVVSIEKIFSEIFASASDTHEEKDFLRHFDYFISSRVAVLDDLFSDHRPRRLFQK